MHTALAAALVAVLQWVTPAGKVQFYAPLRAQGGETHVASVAEDLHDAAKREGLDPPDLTALLLGENESLDPTAVSKGGLSESMMQLRVGGSYHRAWQNACAAVPSYCTWASILIGARVLRACMRASGGDLLGAVLRYRGWRGAARERDLKVVELAAQLRAHMGGVR